MLVKTNRYMKMHGETIKMFKEMCASQETVGTAVHGVKFM